MVKCQNCSDQSSNSTSLVSSSLVILHQVPDRGQVGPPQPVLSAGVNDHQSVPGKPVDPALNKNKTELVILVLPVTLKMFPIKSFINILYLAQN